jgi:MYXO-CTERM domain-containing protein
VKKLVVSALALAALAGSAYGQAAQRNDFRLDLFLVLRSVAPANGVITDIQTGGSVDAVVGNTYRVELRYRINDGTADTVGSRGLTSSLIAITNTAGLQFGTHINRGALSADQGARGALGILPGAAPANPDNTAIDNGLNNGLVGAFPDGVTGMMDPFRGDMGGPMGDILPQKPSNGLAVPGGLTILPLSLSAPNQNSFTGLAPNAGNTNSNMTRWGVYAFEFVYQGGAVIFTADAIADADTQNKFGFWDGSPIPATSNQSAAGTIAFIPAPASAALLGLGGLVAGRRRRA